MPLTPRWTLSDGSATYEFQINPNAAENMVPDRDIRWDFNRVSGFSGTRAPRAPVRWAFSGVFREQQQFEDLLTWLNRRVRLTLTTDLGQVMQVRLLSFKPTQAAGGAARLPYRMTYTMEALIFPDDFYIPKGGLDIPVGGPPPAPALPAPTGVVARQGLGSALLVNWGLVQGATGYTTTLLATGETRQWLGDGGSHNVPAPGTYTVSVVAHSATQTSPAATATATITF